jgi:hypothetical protein
MDVVQVSSHGRWAPGWRKRDRMPGVVGIEVAHGMVPVSP